MVQLLQIGTNGGSGWVAKVSVLIEALVDDFLKLKRNLRIHCSNGGRVRVRMDSMIAPPVLPVNAWRPVAIS